MYILLIILIILLYNYETEYFFSNKIIACNQIDKERCISKLKLSKNKKKCPPVWRCHCDKDI